VAEASTPRTARSGRDVRYAAAALASWTALTAGALFAERERATAAVYDAAEVQASALAEFLVYFRGWNASHGGVWVPVTETLQPSPYLNHVADREAVTTSGRRLTLMNPAWMTREVLEIANRGMQALGHVTSLHPMRPENGPDPWEREALLRLEAGAPRVTELVVGADGERLRFMSPLRVEERCQGCHAAQGQKVGELRGGIAVSVPIAPLRAIGANDLRRQLVIHGIIWLIGVAGILIALADHRRRSAAEAAAARRQAEAEASLVAGRRLEAVGRLSAGVAHDFNNQLAPILTVSGVVRDELPAGSPLREDLEEIRGAALKARDLVRALQTLSRKNGAHAERIPLGRLVAEGEPLLRSFAGTRLAFVLRVAREVPAVLADRPLVELALANLLVNAREGGVVGKAIGMDVGAIDVSPAEAERLRVRAGRHASVVVSEAGVSSTLVADLAAFAPVQGSVADPGGAGVGMPTINGIVAQYGGGVVVRAVPEAGWVVRLLLPEAPPEAG
jgi:signal transduction histidine kinase